MLTGALADVQVARFPSTARRSCARSPIAQSKCNDLQCYSHRGLAHRVIAVGRHARCAAGGGGGGFGGLGGSMGQPIPGLSPAAAEEMVTHVYLCVGAVGEFFDFVTDCFIASSVPIDIRTPSTRPCSLRRNLIGRAKYTEPAGSLHENIVNASLAPTGAARSAPARSLSRSAIAPDRQASGAPRRTGCPRWSRRAGSP